MKTNITDPVFTALSGCAVSINGWRADIETKLSILKQGCCVITPIDPANAKEAEELNTAEIDGVRVCIDPILVDLAMRHHDWVNDTDNAPWTASPVAIAESQSHAVMFVMAWLGRHQ